MMVFIVYLLTICQLKVMFNQVFAFSDLSSYFGELTLFNEYKRLAR